MEREFDAALMALKKLGLVPNATTALEITVVPGRIPPCREERPIRQCQVVHRRRSAATGDNGQAG